MIATQKPFAPKARREFFLKLDPETAKNSLCKIAFFFTKHSIFRLWAKILQNGAEESSLGAQAAVYKGAVVLIGAEEAAEENGRKGEESGRRRRKADLG